MSQDSIVYLNGQYISKSDANFPAEERGTLFAEGVYEVVRIYAGKSYEMTPHLDRLERSLGKTEMAKPADFDRIPEITEELVKKNNLPDSIVYVQITRGAAPRTQRGYENLTSTLFLVAYPAATFDPAAAMPTMTCAFVDDIRWHMCDVKTVMLMPNIMAGNKAVEAGADDAIMHRSGTVTEATAANAFAVKGGEIFTHPANNLILHGITRATVIKLAKELNYTVVEKALTTSDFAKADEVFVSGTTKHVTAITSIDGQPIGSGSYPVAEKLHQAFTDRVVSLCDIAQNA
ncbi:D-alanine aminotransferase [Poriferisphaera corsica]|uniref:D-alanine aminotransferase n=1 Tax=Poriferisphaera corsica TaxID=2528020 RepID=A0A517YQK6_9BACT|nr:aminotransferase class IV [Poriferisphaera corsica]QDU32509.1 D-alanine aminotransferase [Poriferisphaera corsica]